MINFTYEADGQTSQLEVEKVESITEMLALFVQFARGAGFGIDDETEQDLMDAMDGQEFREDQECKHLNWVITQSSTSSATICTDCGITVSRNTGEIGLRPDGQ